MLFTNLHMLFEKMGFASWTNRRKLAKYTKAKIKIGLFTAIFLIKHF